eukprot:Skav232363  [mRNA]  locus=scaffold1062:276425:287100:+ [translate_table: standard]
MSSDQKPFQKTSCSGVGFMATKSCCQTPRAERSTALTAARIKAGRDACASPRTQHTLPAQTNNTIATAKKVKLRLPLQSSRRKVTKGTLAATMDTKATPPKSNALLLVMMEMPFKMEMGSTGNASSKRGRSMSSTTSDTADM